MDSLPGCVPLETPGRLLPHGSCFNIPHRPHTMYLIHWTLPSNAGVRSPWLAQCLPCLPGLERCQLHLIRDIILEPRTICGRAWLWFQVCVIPETRLWRSREKRRCYHPATPNHGFLSPKCNSPPQFAILPLFALGSDRCLASLIQSKRGT